MSKAAMIHRECDSLGELTPFECDSVAAAVINQFNSLPRNGKPAQGEWTVLAGIVAVRGPPDSPVICVLSCCTGTKCLGRSRLQGCGSLLHDSHAEVIARRNMLLSILKEFTQIVTHGPCASSSGMVLEWPLGVERPRVIAGTRLCLYVSQCPCGDASIYDVSDDIHQLLPSKRQRVQERLSLGDDCVHDDEIGSRSGIGASISKPPILQLTGARAAVAGPSSDAHRLDTAPSHLQMIGLMRTKPGRGPPTHCMSCSDKILRWCCEGLEGAAAACLFHLPLASIIIGDQFNATACYRAFTSRCLSLGCTPIQVASTEQVFPFSRYVIEKAAAAAAGDDLAAAADAAAAAAARAAPLSVHWRAGLGSASEVSIANGIRHGATLRARVAVGDSRSSSSALVSVCKRLLFLHTSRAIAAAAAAGVLPPTSNALWGLPSTSHPPPNWAADITWAQAKGGKDRLRWRDRVKCLKGGAWVGAPEAVDDFCLGTAILSLPLEAETAGKGPQQPSCNGNDAN
jgi:hypothetical protein